ncbi:MAG: methionine--tRNA ligase, partial [Spirochaetota bacterium]
FQEKVNGELIGNLANLVNRTLTFVHRYFDGELADLSSGEEHPFWVQAREHEQKITDLLEWANLREAFRTVFAISSLGNKVFQDAEPWKTRHEEPEATRRLLTELVYLIRDLAILTKPYIPATSDRIAAFVGQHDLRWADLGTRTGLTRVVAPEILFKQLAVEDVAAYRERFAGSQAERADAAAAATGNSASGSSQAERAGAKDPVPASDAPEMPVEQRFAERVRLIAAKITSVEKHPEADRLFVEALDDGSGEERQIVSGLVGHYEAEDLEGRTIIVVDNLKPAKLRGVKSQGMLLAASDKDAEGAERVDVLFLDDVEPGTPVVVSGFEEVSAEPKKRIDIDTFFSMPIRAEGGRVMVGGSPLVVAGSEVRTRLVSDGSVG